MSDSEHPFSILVVDDDESNRESLRRRLERRGYSLTVAASGEEALERIAGGRFDLIILDVMMPGMNGLEVLDQVRQHQDPTTLPIIMATAMDESVDVVYALEHGANDYVTKPLDFAVVHARVRTQLQLKRSVDQVRQLEHDLHLRNAELESANVLLKKNVTRTLFELQAAARVQRAFLPPPAIRMAGVRFDWLFEPCTELAGDALNVIRLDDDHAAFYVLDVSGHGVAASLLAVAATRMLSLNNSEDSILLAKQPDGSVIPARPAAVATRLNAQFKFDSDSGQFLTLFYAVLNLRTRELAYVCAGHPGPVLIEASGRTKILKGSGEIIGFGNAYQQQSLHLKDRDRLYVYSDGITECRNGDDSLYGIERFVLAIEDCQNDQLEKSLLTLKHQLEAWRGDAPSHDDVSILAIECSSDPAA